MEEAKRSEKSRADRLRSNLTFRNQRKSEVVLWIFRVRFVCVCFLVYEKGIVHKGRNACPDPRKFDGSSFVWLVFSLSLFLPFPFLFRLIFFPLIFGGAGSALNDSRRCMEVEKEGKKEGKRGWKRGGRTVSKGSKEVFPVVKIARRTFHDACCVFRLDRVDELAHYDTKIYLDLQRGKN